ncbi:Hpr(Ser) kinase/phosphatase [Aminobacter aminovorans]|uniref:HPr kinase/phosphorylase n=2 Tax=Aminobacter aminovorans TaxID=83263 RepID=A0A380WF19_AMIAI|nr:Hpr(Ser) kinase/phosphatase [Aminobacter aminovorans]SUU87501.1 HPr kinase/phosphorylase [Aminobacter aminovorans]
MHATAVVLGDRGVLIAGPSGSGKSSLALALVERFRAGGRFARLISDDQVFLSAHQGRLVCHAPPTIAGLLEIRGLGPIPAEYEAATTVDLLVRLVPASDVERLPEDASERLLGCRLPRLLLAQREIVVSAPVLLAALGARFLA